MGKQYDHVLPLVHRFQQPQAAQRYIVYHQPQQQQEQQQYVVDHRRFAYDQRQYQPAPPQNNYFISDAEMERRHSLVDSVSNDYVLYQKDDDCKQETQKQRRKGWLGSRVHKKKKDKKHRKGAKSSPFMKMMANKHTNTKRRVRHMVATNAGNTKTSRINLPWFLCGSSKN